MLLSLLKGGEQMLSSSCLVRNGTLVAKMRFLSHCLCFSARNSDVNGIVVSMKQLEDRFNKKFKYPYVFLNEQDFDDNFKKYMFFLLPNLAFETH
jgi:hypothetical protein